MSFVARRMCFAVICLGCLTGLSVPANSADIAWVTEPRSPTADFDLGWTDRLTAAGHNVVRMNDLVELDQGKIDALNASDLVIISRSANSGNYDDDNEPQLWNALTSPMINMAAHTVRSNRWKWLNSDAITTGNENITVADPAHPIFGGVAAADIADEVVPGNDELISAVETADGGNGTVLANFASGSVSAVLWEPGVEYYDGAGETSGGYRLFLPFGQSNVSGTDEWGAYNATAEGEAIFMNAVNYMAAVPEPSCMILAGLSLLGLLGIRRNRS